jgi:putative hydrolase of the HAD superfamily
MAILLEPRIPDPSHDIAPTCLRLPIDRNRLETLIFDVDGTLYKQTPVRCKVLWRLLRAHLDRPKDAVLTLRSLKAYRRAQESLRTAPPESMDIGSAQLSLASHSTGIETGTVLSNVARWMESEPLELLAGSLREGLLDFLQTAKDRGILLAVFSDYSPDAKLEAMHLKKYFDVVVSAQDPEVQRFKPDSRGLEITLRRLGVASDKAVYIGDRADIDIPTATKAGMACVLIGRRRKTSNQHTCIAVSNYHELKHLIWQ